LIPPPSSQTETQILEVEDNDDNGFNDGFNQAQQPTGLDQDALCHCCNHGYLHDDEEA
jgi:hypothetical protein